MNDCKHRAKRAIKRPSSSGLDKYVGPISVDDFTGPDGVGRTLPGSDDAYGGKMAAVAPHKAEAASDGNAKSP